MDVGMAVDGRAACRGVAAIDVCRVRLLETAMSPMCPEPPDDLFMVNGGFRHEAA